MKRKPRLTKKQRKLAAKLELAAREEKRRSDAAAARQRMGSEAYARRMMYTGRQMPGSEGPWE